MNSHPWTLHTVGKIVKYQSITIYIKYSSNASLSLIKVNLDSDMLNVLMTSRWKQLPGFHYEASSNLVNSSQFLLAKFIIN